MKGTFSKCNVNQWFNTSYLMTKGEKNKPKY